MSLEDSPRRTMTPAEFARHCNVCRSSICRAVERGDVIEEPDRSIDPFYPANMNYCYDVMTAKEYIHSEHSRNLRRLRDEMKRGRGGRRSRASPGGG